jgi:chromosome segregation protein
MVLASRGTVEERQTRLRDIQQELNQAAQEQDVLLRQHAEKRSRLNILEQLQTAYEGFSAGTVAALKSAQGVLGSLTDKIRVPNEYITAIEAALGNQLQLILTEQPENAERIIAGLATPAQGEYCSPESGARRVLRAFRRDEWQRVTACFTLYLT